MLRSERLIPQSEGQYLYGYEQQDGLLVRALSHEHKTSQDSMNIHGNLNSSSQALWRFTPLRHLVCHEAGMRQHRVDE